uniref:DDE Tnp4 domain-containing protein n=1 Tax=Leptobrachium leishanense TaxID=445787 RepID=A0A8C5PZ95_9ANUR
MDSGEAVAFVLTTYTYLRKTKKRKWWVHPVNCARYRHGAFVALYKPLREKDPVKFFNLLRMSIPSFELLATVRESLMKMDTKLRTALSTEELLVFTLRYLASGCSLQDIHYLFRISRSTAGILIRKVCKTIWNTMKEECIPTPSEETWAHISHGFLERADFPNCIGAVEGKHIRVIKPQRSGSLYMNYKHFFSIGLMAVADASYRFTYVDIGSYGKDSDSTVFHNSTLWTKIQSRSLSIPKPQKLPGTDIAVPFAFVGDEAFGLSSNLLRPYSGTQLSEKKRVFNYRLSRARHCVECSFGILTNKWHIFHRPLNVNVNFAVDIVKCCCVLHNFVQDRDGYNLDDSFSSAAFEDFVNSTAMNVNRRNFRYRDTLAYYFVSESGQIPWQMGRI